MSVKITPDLEKWLNTSNSCSVKYLIIETNISSTEELKYILLHDGINATHVYCNMFADFYNISQVKHIRSLPFIVNIREP